MKQATQICPTTTMAKVKEGALLVDVRREKEVSEVTFDVPNYINIPLNQLEDRIAEIPKNKEIVMVCRSGGRSLKATYFLMNAGYEKVSNMDGGIIKWVSKKFPAKGNVQQLLDSLSCDCSQPDCC